MLRGLLRILLRHVAVLAQKWRHEINRPHHGRPQSSIAEDQRQGELPRSQASAHFSSPSEVLITVEPATEAVPTDVSRPDVIMHGKSVIAKEQSTESEPGLLTVLVPAPVHPLEPHTPASDVGAMLAPCPHTRQTLVREISRNSTPLTLETPNVHLTMTGESAMPQGSSEEDAIADGGILVAIDQSEVGTAKDSPERPSTACGVSEATGQSERENEIGSGETSDVSNSVSFETESLTTTLNTETAPVGNTKETAQVNPPLAGTNSTNSESDDAIAIDGSISTKASDQGEPADIEGTMPPLKYRLRSRVPRSESKVTRSPSKHSNSPPARLPMAVRLLFEVGGFCSVSLLPSRHPNHPDSVEVKKSGGVTRLFALQDAWYQDVISPDVGQVLAEGGEWVGRIAGERVRWSLSGRHVYVLAPRNDLRGFISTTRLVLGERQVVLCTEDYFTRVTEALAVAGCKYSAALRQDRGVPPGWVALTEVVPTVSVPSSNEEDILNALRPLSDVKIFFEGGIRLTQASYLAKHPPKIRLQGEVNESTVVLIDGRQASREPDGSYTAQGWDSLGEHLVWCEGSKTYSVEEASCIWDVWEAHSLVRGTTPFAHTGALITCGNPHTTLAMVPRATPLVVGAKPGEIWLAQALPEEAGEVITAFIPFSPVWCLPTKPAGADPTADMVVLLGKAQLPIPLLDTGYKQLAKLRLWSDAISNCARRRLAVSPENREVAELWTKYQQEAHAVRRALK